MTNDHEQSLRKHLVELLTGGSAHAKFEAAIKGLPPKLRGAMPSTLPQNDPKDIGRRKKALRTRTLGRRVCSSFVVT